MRTSHLKLHCVERLTLLEREAGGHVGLEHGSLLEDGDELGIEAGLEGLAFSGNLGLVFNSVGLSEHGSLLGGTLGSGLLESGVSDASVNLDSGNINLGLGGNDVGLIDTLNWDTVDFVGTSDQEETGFELLKEDNTTTSKTTSQKDQDGTRSDGRT